MDPLIIEPNQDKPGVKFMPDAGILELSEKSLPENALAFYEPVISWLKEYLENPSPETLFNFKLDYFNTASSKKIAQILSILKQNCKTHNIKICWHYEEEDIGMLHDGKRFEKLIGMPFTFIEY